MRAPVLRNLFRKNPGVEKEGPSFEEPTQGTVRPSGPRAVSGASKRDPSFECLLLTKVPPKWPPRGPPAWLVQMRFAEVQVGNACKLHAHIRLGRFLRPACLDLQFGHVRPWLPWTAHTLQREPWAFGLTAQRLKTQGLDGLDPLHSDAQTDCRHEPHLSDTVGPLGFCLALEGSVGGPMRTQGEAQKTQTDPRQTQDKTHQAGSRNPKP